MKKAQSAVDKKNRTYAVVTTLVASVCLIGGAQTIKAAGPKHSDVVVTNTASNPVPVTVQNQPSVTVQNTVPVTIQNPTTTVNVGNTPSVKRADNPAFQPFEALANIYLAPGDLAGDARIAVPAGKRWVIETVSVRAIFNAVTNISDCHVAQDGGPFYYIPLVSQGTDANGNQVFSVANPMRFYADSARGVVVHIERNSTTGQGAIGFSVCGYLVDVP